MAKNEMEINIKISFWMAIKMRISGIFKNARIYRQTGSICLIEYYNKK